MKKDIEQLKESLKLERVMYEEVLKLENAKTEIIRQGKVKELDKMTMKEQQFLMKMGTFEKIRRSVLVNMSEELSTANIETVSELLLHIDDEATVNEIDQLRNDLLEVIKAIHNVNQINEKLMQQHLEYINFSIDIMTNNVQSTSGYGEKATEKEKQKVNLFDARI